MVSIECAIVQISVEGTIELNKVALIFFILLNNAHRIRQSTANLRELALAIARRVVLHISDDQVTIVGNATEEAARLAGFFGSIK